MVVANTETSHLVIRTAAETTADGKVILKNRNYNNIKVAASDADVYAIGQAMSSLQVEAAVAVERVNASTLFENNA